MLLGSFSSYFYSINSKKICSFTHNLLIIINNEKQYKKIKKRFKNIINIKKEL
jgi:hypothetical protein